IAAAPPVAVATVPAIRAPVTPVAAPVPTVGPVTPVAPVVISIVPAVITPLVAIATVGLGLRREARDGHHRRCSGHEQKAPEHALPLLFVRPFGLLLGQPPSLDMNLR